jgi:hypothetical protein
LQVEELARTGHASRSAMVGERLLQTGAAERAIPHLERAVTAFERHGSYHSPAPNLCRAYLAIGDWRRAEATLEVLRAQGEGELGALEPILRAAARDGAFDDALRLWRRRANYDLTDLELLPELVRLGLRDHLHSFYTELAKSCPESSVPARVLAMLDTPLPRSEPRPSEPRPVGSGVFRPSGAPMGSNARQPVARRAHDGCQGLQPLGSEPVFVVSARRAHVASPRAIGRLPRQRAARATPARTGSTP